MALSVCDNHHLEWLVKRGQKWSDEVLSIDRMAKRPNAKFDKTDYGCETVSTDRCKGIFSR